MDEDCSTADLESCAREPIHIPGSIQPHGALLVLDPDNLNVLQATENAEAMLGCMVRTGMPVPAEIATMIPDFRNWLTADASASPRIAKIDGRSLYALAHPADRTMILEFEASLPSDRNSMERLFPTLRSFAEKLSSATDLQTLSAQTTRTDWLRPGASLSVRRRLERPRHRRGRKWRPAVLSGSPLPVAAHFTERPVVRIVPRAGRVKVPRLPD